MKVPALTSSDRASSYLGIRPVNPVNGCRAGQLTHLLDPSQQVAIARQGRGHVSRHLELQRHTSRRSRWPRAVGVAKRRPAGGATRPSRSGHSLAARSSAPAWGERLDLTPDSDLWSERRCRFPRPPRAAPAPRRAAESAGRPRSTCTPTLMAATATPARQTGTATERSPTSSS